MKLFINEGIIPDIEVTPTLQDVLGGKDIVLEKALYYFRHKSE